MRPEKILSVLAPLLVGAACSSSVINDYPPRVAIPEPDPSEVDAVLFLVGDAGGTAEGRSPLLERLAQDVEKWSGELGRDSAVSVAFLGDLVYPDGVHPRDHPLFPQDSARLWSQIDLLTGPEALEHSTLGLFLSGNHDWGNMTGDAAIARAMNLVSELAIARETVGAEVSLYPNIEDSGPEIRDIRNNVRVLMIDSHWWLQERSEEAKDAFFERMQTAIEGAGDREVILLAHHPWASAGPHGVVATGTRAIGLLYLLSKSGTYVQDVNSPAHSDFRRRLLAAFTTAGRVPLVYAAGHDHSLQVMDSRQEGEPRTVIVSGSGSKLSSVEDTTNLRYAAVRPGYMSLIFRRNNAVDLFVTAGSPEYLKCPEAPAERDRCMSEAADSFAVVYSEQLLGSTPTADEVTDLDEAVFASDSSTSDGEETPEELEGVEAPPPAIPADQIPMFVDSVIATPGRSYAGGRVHRWLMGDLNRDLWDIPFKVAVLNLDAVGGSLEPDELSGGKQTLGLKFDGKDGRIYQFRSIVKDASRAIPEALRSSPLDDALQDQMGAQFPLSAMVVAELLEAAGILVAKPRVVVMPDDPRLGEYRELFAGRMGWLEERPNELDGDRPGFAGSAKITGTDELYEELREDPEAYIDDEALLRARLIDLFVGDWDRHYGNWRWASFEDGDRQRWEPIPRDRDWALARIDGFVPALARIYYPKYVGFGAEYPSIKKLTWAAQNFDRRLLNQKTREDFIRVARELQGAFGNSVLQQAIGTLPESYREHVGDQLFAELQSRRDALDEAAQEFYELLAGWVDIRATDEDDHVTIQAGANGSVAVTVVSGDDRHQTFKRTFVRGDTKEVRLYTLDGDDVVEFVGNANLPIRFKIVGGDGDDALVVGDRPQERIGAEPFTFGNVEIFDADPAPVKVAGLEPEEAEELELTGDRPTLIWDRRDWGSEWVPMPAIDYASEFGLHVGARVTRRSFGFGMDPHVNRFSATILGASTPSRLVVDAEFEHALTRNGWYLDVDAGLSTQRITRFFGLGNETTNTLPEESYETRRSRRTVDASLAYRPDSGILSVWAGPRVRRWGRTDVASPVVFELFPVDGSGATTMVGVQGGIALDTRREGDFGPNAGGHITTRVAAYPALAGLNSSVVGAELDARWYAQADGIPGEPALHLGAFAETMSSDAPYFERASLGGRRSLPGYRTGRFRADHSASASALLRARVVGSNQLGGMHLGAHVLTAAGRVWLAGENSNRIHVGTGGGLWLKSDALGRTFSVTLASGERGLRTYFDLGFPI